MEQDTKVNNSSPNYTPNTKLYMQYQRESIRRDQLNIPSIDYVNWLENRLTGAIGVIKADNDKLALFRLNNKCRDYELFYSIVKDIITSNN
jgi:hypothetical protein